MTHPVDLTVGVAGAAMRAGRLSAEALVDAHLARIADRDGAVGAFVHVAADEARARALALDAERADGVRRGPLHGVPFAVKDLIDVAGWPVRHGSRAFAGRVATRTAPVVERLIDAGAIPLGLVATYELGVVGPDAGALYSPPCNPWDRAHVTGGSSSGSAAAVASGMVRLALGTDTGGSVRSPSAYCGAVGLKPTFGALPVEGCLPLAPTMDHVGLIAHDVGDAGVAWAALSGGDAAPAVPLAGRRIGYARDWVAAAPDAHPAVIGAMDDAAASLSLAGARIVPVALPDYAAMEAAAATILHAEALSLHAAALAADDGAMGRIAYRNLIGGAALRDADIALARRAGERLCGQVDAALAGLDAIVTATTLTPAPRRADLEARAHAWTPMRTIPFNLTGHPALSVPMGFAGALPLGMQIVGARGAEEAILATAAAFEAATDHAVADPYRR